MTTETAPNESWWLKLVEDEGIFVKIGDQRAKTKSGSLTEQIIEMIPHSIKGKDSCSLVISCKDKCAPSGKTNIKFNLKFFDTRRSAYGQELSCHVKSSKDFSTEFNCLNNSRFLNANITENENPKEKPVLGECSLDGDAPESVKAMNEKSSVSEKVDNGKKIQKGTKRTKVFKKSDAEKVDLPSPSKKIKPSNIDQEIDAHFLGHIHMHVDALNDICPRNWLDRELNQQHVKEIEAELISAPTSSKNQQPWIGIADIRKEDLVNKEMLRGCRITVIGGRHRHAAYKKAAQVSEIHKKELGKVWILLYDKSLTDEQIRRLAAMHNVGNKGSMTTNWLTRVHSCREWLYKMAGKEINVDQTPASTTEWKKACQQMFVPNDKDENSLEPTLQAALLRSDVYDELRKVEELFKSNGLKDQKEKKKPRNGKAAVAPEITQNQLGMPIQGLKDETKLDLLKQVTNKTISIKELREKSTRIKKKQLVIAQFMKYTGEQSWERLKERFPQHTTEEKLAQFKDSAISRKRTPEEVINFFERAIQWERRNDAAPINLQEERDGVYFYNHPKNSCYGVLMEGSLRDINVDKIKRLVHIGPFKGFPLVIAHVPEETTMRDLNVFLSNVHATNMDFLTRYTVVVLATDGNVKMIQEVLENRINVCQMAFWIDTKCKRIQGNLMQKSIHPLVFGHWSKDGQITEAHCHFSENENASDAFCFEKEENKCYPTELVGHIIQHFSYDGQWVLDISLSKDAGLVAALTHGRNCISLMDQGVLRETAAMSATSVASICDVLEDSEADSD